MTSIQEENSTPISKVQRVRLAADMLGISERTVYRRLRSGKIEQLPVETQTAEVVMTDVNNTAAKEQIASQIIDLSDRLARQNDMTNDNLANLRQELASRDAQIRTLLENQQELTYTIQKLQAQIYELARLALTPAPKTEDRSEAAPAIISLKDSDPKRGLIGRFRSFWTRRG